MPEGRNGTKGQNVALEAAAMASREAMVNLSTAARAAFSSYTPLPGHDPGRNGHLGRSPKG